jgi:hypothetical protein
MDSAVPRSRKGQADSTFGPAKPADQIVQGSHVRSPQPIPLLLPKRIAGLGALPSVGRCHQTPWVLMVPGLRTCPGWTPNIPRVWRHSGSAGRTTAAPDSANPILMGEVGLALPRPCPGLSSQLPMCNRTPVPKILVTCPVRPKLSGIMDRYSI